MEVGQVKAEIMAGVDGFKTKIKDAKETLNTAIDAMKAKSNEMNVAFENMDKKLELWAKQNKVAADSSKYHAKELENNKVKMKELSKQIEVTEKALSETEKQFGKNSTEYKKQEGELLNLKIRYEDLIKETKKLEQSTSVWGRISHNMEKAGDKLKDIGGKMSSVGKEMTMKVTAPIVAVGTAATKMGMDFQKGMTKVNTIAQVGKKDLEALSKSTLKLSDDTGVVAKDLAEMEYNALSASVSVKDLTGVVKQSAELSKGGFADANDSLKLLTSTYNVYRGEFEKGNINQVKASEMIADKMMTIQNLGVTTVGELSTQIGNVTSIAKNANMTLDDLGASMIVLTKNGLGTSQSVTGLKAALSNIIKPSEQASKMAESLGLDFSTTAIKTKGFGGFLKDLREKLKSTSPALVEAADKVSKYQHMIDGASKSQKANKEQMRQWKGQLKDAKEQLKVLTKSGGETTGALAQLFGSVEGLGSVLTLTSEYGMKDFQDGLEASKNSLGSTKKAADMMAETTSERFAKALNKLKNRGIELGLKLMPLAEKGIKYIEEFTDWLSKLNPKTQEFAIKAAIAAAAFGPFVGGVGKAISGIGSMLKLGGDVAKFFALFKGAKVAATAVEGVGTAATVAAGTATGGGLAGLAASFGPLLVAAAPWIAVAAGIAAAGYGIYKVLNKKVIPEVDLFADEVTTTADGMYNDVIKISDSTKKALGSYMELDDKATKALMSLKFNSEKITKENSKNVTDTFNNMTLQITGTMDKKFKEQYGKMEKYFRETAALTDKEEAEILEKKRKNYEFQKKVVEDGNKEIQKIISNAANKHRELTDEEYRVINNIRQNMQTDAVKIMTQGEKEQMVIMERLKRNSSNISAQQAADVIKNSAKARDKTIEDAEKKYNEVVAWVTYERDVTGNLSKEKADKILKAAENEKNGAINHARDMHFQVVQHAREQCQEHINSIDTETGEIMTIWQKTKRWFKDHPITRYIKQQDEKASGYIREQQNRRIPDPPTYKPRTGKPSNWQGYATGTDNAKRGWHEVAEEGLEIVVDRQQRWFNGGETVLNHSKSKEFLAGLVNKVNVMKNMMAGIENVNWYSEGAIFTKPTVLNNIGVGDANNGHGSAPEAVMPIDKLEDYLYNAFVKAIKDTGVGNINMDGRKFLERLSPHMAMATKGRR